MDYKKKIKDVIDRFYIECVDEFKEAEIQIANDSKFRSMFRKKDYDGNIKTLREIKKRTHSVRFPTGDIQKGDTAAKELIKQTENCIRQLGKLCDAYVQLQTTLKRKSEGYKVSLAEYNEVYRRSQEQHVAANRELKELDILYTDYFDDEDYEVYEFLD